MNMGRASIRQVAEHAGVSPMTVSRMVRGQHESVSPDKRQRVLSSMQELDYVPVRPALQNRRSKTNVIGLVVDVNFTYKGLVAPHTFDGIREAAFAANYDVLMLHSSPHSPLGQQKMQFLDRRCDGFIFVSPKERREVLENLVQHDFPTVSCYSTDVPEGIAWVTPDNTGTIQRSVQALIEAGHQRIAHIAGPHHHSTAVERRKAYLNTMLDAGLKPLGFEMNVPDDGEQAANFLLDHQATGIVCYNDHWALNLWQRLEERGLHIPQDISIIGVDNTPDAEKRGLSTFINPYEEIGRTAVQSLFTLLDGGDLDECCRTIKLEMVARHSVGPPR